MDTIQFLKDIIQALISELLRFRVVVAFTFALVLALMLIVALNWPKYYISSSVIVKDITNVIEPLLRGTAQLANADKNENVRGLIFSRKLLDKSLKIVNPDFLLMSPEEQAKLLMVIKSNLKVDTQRGTNVTKISYRSDTPDEAYETLKAVVDVFLGDRIADKQEKSHEAHDFISGQVDEYKRRLIAAENRLKEFKSNSVDESEGAVKSRISSLVVEIQNLKISIEESMQIVRTTKAQLESEGSNVATRKKVFDLEERSAALTETLEQLRLIYQDNYPDIVVLKSQLRDIEEKTRRVKFQENWSQGGGSDLPLLEELRKQLALAEVELGAKKRRMAALKELLLEEQELADIVSATQAEYLELNRDYSVTKSLYEQMLTRRENAKISLALNDEGQGESYKLVDAPNYPLGPDGIRALYIFLSAPVVAFFVPIVLLVALVLFDPRLRSVTLISAKLPEGVILLADIPHRSSPLSSKLLRKDIFVLLFFALSMVIGYFYSLYVFRDVL